MAEGLIIDLHAPSYRRFRQPVESSRGEALFTVLDVQDPLTPVILSRGLILT